MGKVVFDDPVHHISGRISKKYRTCYNYRKWSDRKYTSVHGDRTTPASTEELAQRQKFRVVRLAALNRSMDLSHLTYDQMDFIEEKKTKPNFKYTTYKGWLFGKAWKCYNESTHEVNMPDRLKNVGSGGLSRAWQGDCGAGLVKQNRFRVSGNRHPMSG